MRSLSILFVFSAIAVLGLSCHPYYNTFYNAEEAFGDARRKHSKVMRNFPDSLVVTPSEQMASQYERSIEKSLKMMEIYPKDVKRQDRAHYLMGRAAFYKMDFEVCVSRMRDLQTAFPESPLVPRSNLYVAKAHIMMDNLAIAEELLLKLLEDHPELDKNQEITMLLVEIAMRRGGRAHALLLLDKINLSGLPIEKQIEIILRKADLQFELRQYEQALRLLRSAPRKNKLPFLMYRVDRSIYFCLDALDSFDAALRHLGVMEKNRRFKEQRYEILYYKAVTLRRMGRVDEAIAILEGIRKMCGRIAESDTMSLCGRNAYELAGIYMAMGRLDLAMELFEEASARGDSVFTGMVDAKLLALRKLKELREPDSTGKISVEARYSIAELFQFDLRQPDSAYNYYIELTAGPDADTAVRPKALLMAAMVARSEMADTARSDSLLLIAIKDYEGSEYARRAQIEMGAEVTVVTPREAVEREFRTAEAIADRDMVEAVKAFYNIYKENPEMDIAPMSLYAAAWYTDNALGRKRAAMTLYEELCNIYPETDLCKNQAKPRLAIAKDSIEARRKRREETKAAPAAVSDSSAVSTPAATDSTGAAIPPLPIEVEEVIIKDDDDDDGDDDGGDGGDE